MQYELNNIRFERLNETLLKDVTRLHNSVYKQKAKDNLYQKKYNTSYAGKINLGIIAYDEANIPISFCGIIPCFLHKMNERILAGQIVDGMTEKEYRKKGIFSEILKRIADLCIDEGIQVSFGFPNQNSHEVEKKAGWTETDVMDRFEITVHTLPVIRLFPFIKNYFIRQQNKAFKKYLLGGGELNSSIENGNHWSVLRDRDYLLYKCYSGSFMIKSGSGKMWVRLNEVLFIGDVPDKESEIKNGIKKLKRIAFLSGVKKIIFQASTGSRFHDLFINVYEPMPSFPVLIRSFAENIDTENIKFTFADLDLF